MTYEKDSSNENERITERDRVRKRERERRSGAEPGLNKELQ